MDEKLAAKLALWNIPEGYSVTHWDTDEVPLVLLGSVFDANSLGKWMYDWTVYRHGGSSPMAGVAGDLWTHLIKLAGKMKRAEVCLPRIRGVESRALLDDFIQSGYRLWRKFEQLLRACENYMWRTVVPGKEGKKVLLGKNAGMEFVATMFGRDRELVNTEQLVNSIRLWSLRFDANCNEILKSEDGGDGRYPEKESVQSTWKCCTCGSTLLGKSMR